MKSNFEVTFKKKISFEVIIIIEVIVLSLSFLKYCCFFKISSTFDCIR